MSDGRAHAERLEREGAGGWTFHDCVRPEIRCCEQCPHCEAAADRALTEALSRAEHAEAALASLRAEVGAALAVARSVHAHGGQPCASGLDHLPPETGA